MKKRTLRRVTGTWKGTYGYQPSARLPARAPVAFTLSLEQGWFGRFKGTVRDDGDGGMPGTGVVEGRFSFPRIEFTKRMPVCYIATPDGRCVSLREFLIEQGHVCEHDVPHMPIFYEGRFSSPKRAEGSWVIKSGSVRLADGRGMSMTETKGTWSIDAL